MNFEQNREVFYSQLDPEKKVASSTILQYFQDIAVAHTEEIGFSLDKLSAIQSAWILLSMHVKFLKPILQNTNITVKTWTYEFGRVCGPRAYYVLDADSKEKYAVATGMWTYINTETGRPMEIPPEIIEYYGEGEAPEISYLRRAPSFAAEEHLFDFKVLKRDLDSNGHMNNVKYFEYALEALPAGKQLAEVEMFYKQSAFLGDKISVFHDAQTHDSINLVFKNQEGANLAYIKFVLG